MVTSEEGQAVSSVNEVATDGNKGQSYQLRGKSRVLGLYHVH